MLVRPNPFFRVSCAVLEPVIVLALYLHTLELHALKTQMQEVFYLPFTLNKEQSRGALLTAL